jgi:hypothetical protein
MRLPYFAHLCRADRCTVPARGRQDRPVVVVVGVTRYLAPAPRQLQAVAGRVVGVTRATYPIDFEGALVVAQTSHYGLDKGQSLIYTAP